MTRLPFHPHLGSERSSQKRIVCLGPSSGSRSFKRGNADGGATQTLQSQHLSSTAVTRMLIKLSIRLPTPRYNLRDCSFRFCLCKHYPWSISLWVCIVQIYFVLFLLSPTFAMRSSKLKLLVPAPSSVFIEFPEFREAETTFPDSSLPNLSDTHPTW